MSSIGANFAELYVLRKIYEERCRNREGAIEEKKQGSAVHRRKKKIHQGLEKGKTTSALHPKCDRDGLILLRLVPT